MIPVTHMMSMFMVDGVIGNSIVILMYRSRKQQTSANVFMMFLAGIDLFACGIKHPLIYKLLNFYNQIYTAVCKGFEFLMHVNLLISSLFLVVVAVDRFLTNCRPLWYLKFYQHITKVIVLTCVVGIFGSVPLLEFYGPNSSTFEIEYGMFVGYMSLPAKVWRVFIHESLQPLHNDTLYCTDSRNDDLLHKCCARRL